MWNTKALSYCGFLVAAGMAMGAAQSPIVGLTGPDPYTVITNAAGIVRLSPELAKSGLPVRLRGQVTSYDHLRVLFVQDKTAGVFVYYTGDRLPLRPGQYVQVTGVAQPGRFSPIITAPVIELLDSGPTINPQSVSLAQIQYGGLDAQWVEFSGVVRKQGIIESRLWLEVADPPQRVEVWVADYQASDQLPLCGGRVRIRGVVGSRVNPAGEILGFQVFANSPAALTVLQPPPLDRFAAPLRSIKDLQAYDARSGDSGGVRVRGCVTLCQPGKAIFVQDDTGGVEVLPQPPFAELMPGTLVEVVGYPGPITQPPRLEDALVRKEQAGGAPEPMRRNLEDVIPGHYENQLVAIEASYEGIVTTPSNSVALVAQANDRLLTALLDTRNPPPNLSRLLPGCRIRLTGVYRSKVGPVGNLEVVLLLRSPTDITVLSPPAPVSGSGLPVLGVVAAVVGVGLAVALGFILKQHRRTEHMLELQASLQTEMRQGELQIRRSLEERERIGRDLHDDIIQSIYAAGLGLEDCRRVLRLAPDQAENRLTTSIQTLNDTIRTVRGFIAGLEPKVVTGREFKTALKSLALTSGDAPSQFQFHVASEAANSLTSTEATQLLHIAKEAMSNSLRHSSASGITVSLQAVSGGINLEIRDDGVGFDPGTAGGKGQGLRNMAARVREIGGQLETISAPGQGCRTIVTVPKRNPNEPQ